MRKNKYILAIIALLISFQTYSQDKNSRQRAILKQLLDNNLGYDSIAPIDSVILWGQQISPIFEEEKEKEFFFRVKQLVVHLYSIRGDIGEAIDEARQMYEKAQAINYNLGIALSSLAIGDAYYCSNMPEEAIESYKEAIHYPATASGDNHYKEIAILKLISVLMKEGKMQEAEAYRNKLLKSGSIHTQPALHFFTLAMNAAYYLQNKDLQRAYDCFSKMEQAYHADEHPYLYPLYRYMQGRYMEAIGEYSLALECYDELMESIRKKMTSVSYLQLAYIKANLLVHIDRKEGAARLYEEISAITDSVVTPSYTHRINGLRAAYQKNQMEVENKAEINRIYMGGILFGCIVLASIIYLSLHIHRQNKKITISKALLEQSRQNAESAMQTKSLFLSNMSHEIRTPLSALSGFSGLLTEQGLDTETRRQCGDIIQQNSDLLLKLINDVIDLSNLKIGDMKFHFGFHDAVIICNNVIDTVNKVKQTQAEVLFITELESLTLYTDDSRLQQLLINLLINATKFTPEGSITLKMEQPSANVALFSVTDTGCGIPPEKQNAIFNRFEKLNEGEQGTGLGLSICQLIIERIGGKIWIDPNYTDGCRFYFTHPIHPDKEGKEAQA